MSYYLAYRCMINNIPWTVENINEMKPWFPVKITFLLGEVSFFVCTYILIFVSIYTKKIKK